MNDFLSNRNVKNIENARLKIDKFIIYINVLKFNLCISYNFIHRLKQVELVPPKYDVQTVIV